MYESAFTSSEFLKCGIVNIIITQIAETFRITQLLKRRRHKSFKCLTVFFFVSTFALSLFYLQEFGLTGEIISMIRNAK